MSASNNSHPGTRVTLPSDESVRQLFCESEMTPSLIYIFPQRLIECFRTDDNDAGPSLLSQVAVNRELAFTKPTRFHSQVGFRKLKSPSEFSIVNYHYWGDTPGSITPESLRKIGSKYPIKAAEELNAIAEPHFRTAQAYCGWMLQQETYWRDLKSVIGLFGECLAGELLPQQVFSRPKGAKLVEEPHSSTLAFRAFCEKWRLQGMATLDLPIVISPQLTPDTIYSPNSYPGSVTPFLPDIFPVDAKGPKALALENARMRIEAPHLEEWKSLISISSREKKRIDRYARQFNLQHYWRVLLQRYPKQLHRRKSVIEEAFGNYFSVTSRVISRDSQELAILIDRNLSTFL